MRVKNRVLSGKTREVGHLARRSLQNATRTKAADKGLGIPRSDLLWARVGQKQVGEELIMSI